MTRTIALGYARKSLVTAGTDPASPEMQVNAIERAAKEHGWALELYQDTLGHNSGRSDQRPGWKSLTARLHDPAVAAVVVYSFDRLFRNVRHMLAFADEATQAGVKVVSVKDPIDFSTAQGRLMLTMMAGMGEWYANDVADKRRAAIDQLRRGRGRHYGDAPFGTERLPHNGDRVLFPSSKTQPNGTDFECLRAVYELHAAGEMGARAMAKHLNCAGWQFRGRAGLRPWLGDDVRRVLSHHWVYAGFVPMGRTYRGHTELLKGSHGALLPAELTAAAGASFAAYRRGYTKELPLVYPLSGLVRCPLCEARLTGSKSGPRRYYRHPDPCTHGATLQNRADKIEDQARAHIAGLAIPDNLASGAGKLAADMAASRAGQGDSERARLGLERLAELYLAGDVDRAFYDRRKAELMADAQPEPEPDILWGSVGDPVDVLGASPAGLRNVARALYWRIDVRGHEIVKYYPLDWCKDWAGV